MLKLFWKDNTDEIPRGLQVCGLEASSCAEDKLEPLAKEEVLAASGGSQAKTSDLTRQKSNLVTQAGYQCDTNHNDNFLQVMGTHNVYRWPKWLKEHVLFWSTSPRDMVL